MEKKEGKTAKGYPKIPLAKPREFKPELFPVGANTSDQVPLNEEERWICGIKENKRRSEEKETEERGYILISKTSLISSTDNANQVPFAYIIKIKEISHRIY